MAAIAKVIRSTTSYDAGADRFDLAGFSESQAIELANVFKEPLHATEPLRFTFVIGGGRLVRTKYDSSLGKWFMGALSAIGYDDDRGASLGSQGSYKRQEDLGQNLVYVHVFPRIAATPTPTADAPAASAETAAASPSQRVLTCSTLELQRIIPSRAPTWSEKRTVLALVTAALTRLDEYEARMAARVPLSATEQAEYDTLSREALDEKSQWLHAQLKAAVSGGQLTALEFETVLREMDAKLAALRSAAAAATAGDAAARAAAAVAALEEKRSAVARAAARPMAPPPLRGEAEIRKARGTLAAIERVEKAAHGRLMTLAEAREVGARPDVEARLAALLAEARGWWESSEAFEARVAASARQGKGGAAGVARR